jgi:hypothetical protein
VRVTKAKTHDEKLFGAAVVKMGFLLRGTEESAAFRGIFPGLLRDLNLTDEQVDAFIELNRERVESAAGGKLSS